MKGTVKLTFIIIGLVFIGTMARASAFNENIKVGVLLPLTGKLASLGEIEQKSFLMALNEINEAGGIDGKKIDLIFRDTAGKPEVGRSAIEQLIQQDKVCIVGGGVSSSVTWATIKVAQKNRVPFLVNTASADKITEKGGDFIFRLNPPASEYNDALNSFLTKVARIKTAAILYENTPFGYSSAKGFTRQCQKIGLRVVAKEAYEAEVPEFKHLLNSINAREPDLLYIICSSTGADASMIVTQAKELKLNARLLVGGGVVFTLSEFQKDADDASDYVFSVTLWEPSVNYPGARDYYDNFVKKYNEPTEYHGAQAYAAMYVIADALRRAKDHTAHDVRDALFETDMMTIFGPVKFISYGKKKLQNKIPTLLGQWIQGKYGIVWPRKLATVKYVYPMPSWGGLSELY